ncbi:MAG: hypothetical protein N2378_03660, partial [Chloroflexaceae bacterium]|nr:hypothetical protein [Chloroflexaceae bacterium]
GLAAGRYCVDVDETTVPAGLTLTTNNDPLLVNLGPGQSFLNADFGYREFVCGLSVNGRCLVTPPPTQDLVCRDKIVATTLRYTGPSIAGATVEFRPDRSPAVRYTNVNLVSGETVLTLPSENGFTVDARPDGSELGAKTTILINGVAQIIHTSCSTPYVAGQPAPLDDKSPAVPGNPNPSKGDPSPTWFVENFFDKTAGLVQLPTPPQLSESCSIQAVAAPSCTSEGKPTSLTFRYTGAACDPTGNRQGSKFVCSGSPNNAEPVQLVVTRDADKISVSPSGQTIRVGDLVTLTRTDGRSFAADTFLAIRQGATTLQTLTIHTSCSQPLAVGDRFGSLTLVAFNGKRAGAEVTFITEVRNSATGAPLSNVRVTDNPFNNLLNPFGFALGAGASRQLDPVVANIETSTNYVVTAVGTLPNGQVCTASDTVPVVVTR